MTVGTGRLGGGAILLGPPGLTMGPCILIGGWAVGAAARTVAVINRGWVGVEKFEAEAADLIPPALPAEDLAAGPGS